ncbi:MAG: arabinose efflux permease [Firmicutes bacterium]|nr:arabinose efflux permease [Bacillota bacterium]
MNYVSKLHKNIQLSYIFNCLLYFRTTNAIWVIYLCFKGISLTQIGILEAIFHATSFLFDVPTGALADLFGRRISMVCGRIASIISAILMMVCDSMWGFSLAFVFSGLSYTLNSGAGTSLLYDSLVGVGEEWRYTKVAGLINALGEVAQAVAVALGGYLADTSFLYAYIAILVVDSLAIGVMCKLVEPIIVREQETRRGLIAHIRESVKVLLATKIALYLMLYLSFIVATSTTVYFYCQKYFEAMHYSYTAIAILFSIDSLLRAACARYAYIFEEKAEQTKIIVSLLVFVILGLAGLAMASGMWGVVFYYIISVADGVAYPIFSGYINSLLPSEQRATLLSMESTMFSLGMIVIFPLVGLLSDSTSLNLAFLVLAIFLGLLVMVLLRFLNFKQRCI